MKIDSVIAHSILDTRGKPTVEVEIAAQQGSTLNPNPQGRTLNAIASVPSGKSTGSHEACELRDAELPYGSPAAGGGVETAVANVNGEISHALRARDWNSPDEIDDALIALDGTPDKSRLGANAILAVSIAAQRLFAQAENVPLWKTIAKRAGTEAKAPRLFINMVEGGVHADFRLPFQEYILVVEGRSSAALAEAHIVFTQLGEKLGSVPMGDEGGYSPTFATLDEPFNILKDLTTAHPGTSIAIDAAASELFKDGAYHLLDKSYSPEELTKLYADLTRLYSFHSIEDPFAEDATADFAKLTAEVGNKILVIGDDFTVTNPARIEAARQAKAINAVLIKPNQIGTVKEAIEAVRATYTAGWQAVCSHRSGETADTFIADFAYGVGAHGIKAGGLGQKERLEKYERLVEIEKEAETVY